MASQQLANWGNHTMMTAHREVDGEAEFHENQADIFIAQSGEAVVEIGGSVDSPRTTAAGEIRGPSITGATRNAVKAGDILHIPAKTAHRVLVEPGKQFTYVVVKVSAK